MNTLYRKAGEPFGWAGGLGALAALLLFAAAAPAAASSPQPAPGAGGRTALEQKVQGHEARTAWREIVTATSDPAPGDVGLRLPPDAERLAAMPSWRLTKLGVVHRRAVALREAARHPKKIATLVEATREEARVFLEKLPGVGPWTSGEVRPARPAGGWRRPAGGEVGPGGRAPPGWMLSSVAKTRLQALQRTRRGAAPPSGMR